MAKARKSHGEWAFLAGVLLAIVLGLIEAAGATLPGYVGPILVLLGLVVGALNISSGESQGFLLGAVALLLVKKAGLETLPYGLGSFLDSTLGLIAVFVAPAALLVALRVVYGIAKG